MQKFKYRRLIDLLLFLFIMTAAILLSGFTDQAPALLLGTDIGGLGTLVASMASLISYGMYIRAFPGRQSYYLKIFTLWNAAYLAVLIPFARIFQGI